MNIIAITIDTQRWDHFGYNNQRWMGSKLPILTPNIDRFSQRATIFDRCMIGSFPTVPHRMDSFTGMTNFPLYDWQELPDDLISVTEVLKDAGYYCATVADTGNFISANITRGMDEIHHTLIPPKNAPKKEDMPFPVPKTHIRQKGAQRQRHAAEQDHFKYESDWWVSKTMTRAADWLQDNAQRDNWFLWVDTFEVHELWKTPQYYVDLYDANYEGRDYDFPRYGYTDIYSKKELRHMWAHYAAEVTLTDRWIGHLLDQVELMDLWDDTMVVFTSDHGMYIGEHKRAGKHTVAGAKDPWPLYEEVAHVPLLCWIPPKRGKKMKSRVKALAQPADFMPTMCDVAGVKCPDVYGKSLLPLMTGKAKSNFNAVFSAKHNSSAKRLSICPTWLTVTTDKWSYIAQEENDHVLHKAELFDIKADPGQKRNLARKNPAVCKQLQKKAADFLRNAGAEDAYVERLANAL